jgi:hypothetical protein
MNNLELRIARARLAAMKPFPHKMATPRDLREFLRKLVVGPSRASTRFARGLKIHRLNSVPVRVRPEAPNEIKHLRRIKRHARYA